MSFTLESERRLAQKGIHQQWERDYLCDELETFYNEAFAFIVSELGETAGKNLLDLGCGNCFHTTRIAKSDLSIVAVDFSTAALEQAEKTILERGLGEQVSLQQADATKLSFENESFDHVLLWGVLMHIPEVEKALTEAARVLKPGGKLVLAENNANSLEARFVEPTINFLRSLAGKDDRTRRKAHLGVEEWQAAQTGGLMIRKTDTKALTFYMKSLGLTLDKRVAGQFTELYTRIPLRRAIHAFNLFWFRKVRSPHLAYGNILIFQKRS